MSLLPAHEAALLDAVRRHQRRSRRLTRAAIVVALAVALVVPGVIVLGVHGGRSAGTTEGHRDRTPAPVTNVARPSTPAALLHAYALFRRPRRPGDRLDGQALRFIMRLAPRLPLHVFPQLARGTNLPDGNPVWIVPGPSTTCLIGPTVGECIATGDVASHGFVSEGIAGSTERLTGVVPDGAGKVTFTFGASGRQPVQANVRDNAFEITITGRAHRLHFNGPDGPVSVLL